MNLKQKALEIHLGLLDFFGQPLWREPYPPLDELVSTILSQNTNDVNRDRAYEALRNRFPTWEEVRDAEEMGVVEAIRPAGLAQQKGPRIQGVLKEITRLRGSLELEFLRDMPADEVVNWLRQFKGVGPKTAAIVALFSLNKPAFPVDTHIYRITGRVGLRPVQMSVEQAHKHLESLFPQDGYYSAHLNLIRLGREICKARRPDCSTCPINKSCDYYARLLDREDGNL